MFRILDLDNCISDDEHRIPLIKWAHKDHRRYLDYHQLAGFDELRNEDLLNTEERIVILTGRPVMFRALTQRWLREKGVPYWQLVMRNDDDVQPSSQLKLMQLLWLRDYYDVGLESITSAFDDRPEVIAVYTKAGIVNAQVRFIHTTDAYTCPQPPKS